MLLGFDLYCIKELVLIDQIQLQYIPHSEAHLNNERDQGLNE